jgi:hypothetical protein
MYIPWKSRKIFYLNDLEFNYQDMGGKGLAHYF